MSRNLKASGGRAGASWGQPRSAGQFDVARCGGVQGIEHKITDECHRVGAVCMQQGDPLGDIPVNLLEPGDEGFSLE
jgi:hypothetical protein